MIPAFSCLNLLVTDERIPVRRRVWIGWTIAAVALAVLVALGWVVVRGIGATLTLQSVASDARELNSRVADGEVAGLEPIIDRMVEGSASARSLTGDLVWRAFEIIPLLGPNFTAVREVSEIADDISGNALGPLAAAADGIDSATFGVVNGRIDLAPLQAVAPSLDAADAVLNSAQLRAHRIDAGATLPPLRSAVDELTDAVDEAATAVGALSGAAALLPGMLGADGPRTYLLLMQNNAELRTSGGIPGAVALLHAESGHIALGRQADTTDFPAFATPVLPLAAPLVALFEEKPGRFMQNTVNAPDFATAAQLSAEMWRQRMGDTVDGVIGVDAVVLGRLLEATGPVQVGGMELSSNSATQVLLSDVYGAVENGDAQNAFFALTAATLFSKVMSGSIPPRDLIGALADAADENRIRVFSAHPDEQARLATTALSGALPADTDDARHIGVFVNDTTGGKMNFYTDAAVSVAEGGCHGDGRREVRVTVTWENNAPDDAATALPPYVTAGGMFDVPPGDVRTLIAVYGPEGWDALDSAVRGKDVSTQATVDRERPVVQHEVLTSPGEATTVTVAFLAPDTLQVPIEAIVTPMVRPVPVTAAALSCG